eukprot:1977458-Rhodomonas_salina.4
MIHVGDHVRFCRVGWLTASGISDPKAVIAASSDPPRLARLVSGFIAFVDAPLNEDHSEKIQTAFAQAPLEYIYDPVMGDITKQQLDDAEATALCGYHYDADHLHAHCAECRVPIRILASIALSLQDFWNPAGYRPRIGRHPGLAITGIEGLGSRPQCIRTCVHDHVVTSGPGGGSGNQQGGGPGRGRPDSFRTDPPRPGARSMLRPRPSDDHRPATRGEHAITDDDAHGHRAVGPQVRTTNFVGATGPVVLDPRTGDRDYNGVAIVMKNWLPGTAADGSPTVDPTSVAVYLEVRSRWHLSRSSSMRPSLPGP